MNSTLAILLLALFTPVAGFGGGGGSTNVDPCANKLDYNSDVYPWLQKSKNCRYVEKSPIPQDFADFQCELSEHATLTKLKLPTQQYFIDMNRTSDSKAIANALLERYKPRKCITKATAEGLDQEVAKTKIEYKQGK